MTSRAQLLAAVVVVTLVVGGGAYLQDTVGAKPPGAPAAAEAPSGAWLCPHGGGRDWGVTLQIADPGPDPVSIRVTGMGDGKPSKPRSYTVQPGGLLSVPATAAQRGAGSLVEYFGGWVAAGWVAHAGGGESGTAAEPCLPQASQRWLVPDGTAEQNQDDYVVVMNPFAAEAVFTLTLYTTKRPAPITPGDWTNVVLKPYRSQAFRLNPKALGESTVSTLVDVKVGRVAVSMLGASGLGGIRSSVGVPGTPPRSTILPGGFDQGASDLVVMNPTEKAATLQAQLVSKETSQGVASLVESSVNPGSAATFPVTTEGPSGLVVTTPPGVAVARRTLGVTSDQGSTAGTGRAAGAWVVLPAVAGAPDHPGLVLVNPGAEPIDVTLSSLPVAEGSAPTPVTVQVPAGRSIGAPRDFLEAEPTSAVLAVSSGGTFVAAASSYSLGREGYATYAVSLGVPVPEGWVSRSTDG